MKKLQLPDLGPVWRLLLYLATAVFAVLSIVCAAFEGMFPEEAAVVVRPRACFLARSFSGSEKRRVRKPKNHLLCKWIRMLQLTEKPPML